LQLQKRLDILEQATESQRPKPVKYFSQGVDNPNHWYAGVTGGEVTGEPLTLAQVQAAKADFLVIQVCYG